MHELLEHSAPYRTLGLADEVDRDLGLDRLVRADAHEVDVDDVALDGVALELTGDRELLGAVDVQRDQRVHAAAAGEDVDELPLRHGHRDVVGAEPVDDRRNKALAADAAGGALAPLGAAFCDERGIGHGASILGSKWEQAKR